MPYQDYHDIDKISILFHNKDSCLAIISQRRIKTFWTGCGHLLRNFQLTDVTKILLNPEKVRRLGNRKKKKNIKWVPKVSTVVA